MLEVQENSIRPNYQLVRISDDPEQIRAYYDWESSEDEKEKFCFQDFNNEVTVNSEAVFLKFEENFKQLLTHATYYLLKDAETGKYIGFISLTNFTKRNRSAEVSFALFKGYRNLGLGTLMLTQFLHRVFGQDYNWLHKIYGETGAFNIPSIKVFEKHGFHKDGIMRDHYWVGGKIFDQYVYSLLRSEWEMNKN